MTEMPAPPAPCGYCRRCAVHDDPGGCTTVEQWCRENPEADRFWRREAAMTRAFGIAAGERVVIAMPEEEPTWREFYCGTCHREEAFYCTDAEMPDGYEFVCDCGAES